MNNPFAAESGRSQRLVRNTLMLYVRMALILKLLEEAGK